MNAFGLAGLLTGVSSLAMGIFVFSKGPTQKLNQLWCIFTYSVAAWGFGALWISMEKNPSLALLAWKITYAFGVIWIPVLFYHFVLIFCEIKKDRLLLLHYTLGAIFSWLAFFSPLFFSGSRFVFSSFYYGTPGFIFPIYFAWWSGLVFYAHYRVYKSYRAAASIRRNQFKYMFLAFVLSYSTGSLAYLPVFGIDLYPYGTFGIMFYPIIVTYAIISYRAMEIETVVHKTAAWLTISSAVVVPIVGIFYMSHQAIDKLSPLGHSFLVAFTGLLLIPYVKWILPRIDHIFQRRKYDLKTVLQNFIHEISALKKLEELILRFQTTISSVLYPSGIAMILFDIGKEELKPLTVTSSDVELWIKPHTSFLKWLTKFNAVANKAWIEFDTQYADIKKDAQRYFLATNTEVLVPFVHNEKLFGLLNLSQKTNLKQYSDEELEFLNSLKIEGSIAISNSLLYADVRKMSEELQRWATELEGRVEDRTRDLEKSYTKLQEMDQLKSRFFANISHELRTPLTLLMGPAEMMLRGELGGITESQEEYLNVIRTHSARLLRLINDLLNLSKSDAGEARLLLKKGDFLSFVRRTINTALPAAEKKSLTLALEAGEKIPDFFYDPEKMEDVLLNLLSNALKFTQKGGIRIACTQTPGDVLVRVSDTGPGISKDAIGKLFTRFFQVDTEASRAGAGTGIGLSLSKEWVELHKGKIWVESEEGKGSSFFFSLPLRLEEEGSSVSLESLGTPREVSTQEKEARLELNPSNKVFRELPFREGLEHVLIVDDNVDMLHFIGDQLKSEYNLSFGENGAKGVALAFSKNPDLIISDIMMPIKDGYQLCRELKSDPQTARIPIILLTAKGDLSDKIEGLECGADDYLTKPFNKGELLARVRSLVHKRKLQEEIALKNKQLQEALAELQKKEQELVQSEKMASLGLLTAGVAHEISNPISFAKGSLSVVNRFFEKTDKEEGRTMEAEELLRLRKEARICLDVIKTGLERTDGIVKNLHAFGRKDEMVTRVDIHAGLDSTITLLNHLLRGKIAIHREYGSKNAVYGIGGQLNQAFMNIFHNAIQAIETQGEIFVKTTPVEDGLRISIRDTGKGIAEADLPHVFEPFFTTKDLGKGTGLGMAITYKIIVETHHGKIDLKSALGKGTEVFITLPLTQPIPK
jgi:signal transduction histidine kinase